MKLRVDTYENYLCDVEVKTFDSPYTTLGNFTGAAITAIEGGAYEVEIGSLTGNWLIILRDSNSEVLGLKYASTTYLTCADYPPWLLSSGSSSGSGSETVTLLATHNGIPIPSTTIYITSDSPGSNVVLDNLITNEYGKVTCKLNPGTYYVWRNRAGYSFLNPQQIQVLDV